MKGKVLEFDSANGAGLISGDDGQRYSFDKAQWKGDTAPGAGAAVDFTSEDGKAMGVYPDVSQAQEGASKKIAAALLAFFLGAFGIHKFYLGYNKQGVIMLLVFMLGWILLGLPSLIIAIIAFIEFILYIIKSDDEFYQTYVKGHRPWF